MASTSSLGSIGFRKDLKDLDRKGDETEPHIYEIPKRILLVSWGRDTSRPALDDVGS